MEAISMRWKCLVDTLPLPNTAIMVGEIDESPISMQVLLARSLIYMQIAENFRANFIQTMPEKYNFPALQQGKIVLQFVVAFPTGKQLKKILKELSLLD